MLWTLADDEGRLRGNSRMLARTLYPYDDDADAKIDDWLIELAREQCILRYSVAGDSYIEICNWLKHQRIDKPSKSKFPSFQESSPKRRESSRSLLVGSGSGSGSGSGLEGNGKEKPLCANANAFDAFWSSYPKKRSKGDAEKAWAKLHPNSELVERILSAMTRAKTCTDWMREGGKFIPHPATWLNAKGWEDDYGTSRESGMEVL